MARLSDVALQDLIDRSIARNDILSVRTFYLSDYGEKALNKVVKSILAYCDRMDLMDIIYTCTKELMINGTKSNLKRVMFARLGLDPFRHDEYERGMENFKEELREENVRKYKSLFKENNYTVTATFYYTPQVLNIKIKNNAPLAPQEERRIREKFQQAVTFANLIEFYLEHGDSTEGAGLGMTMVGILLDQSGIDKHAFTLYSNEKYGETAARLEIPLTPDYISRRTQFEKELANSGLSREELRSRFRPTSHY